MSPADLLGDRSFEIPARGHARLTGVDSQIARGTTVSIAFLASDSIAHLVQAAAVVRRLGFTPKPHLAARRQSSREELIHLLRGLRDEAGADRAFVIAGDAQKPLGPPDDALAVINTGLLAEFGIKRVGIAGYPDGHPAIPEELLWHTLWRNSAALVGGGHEVELVTQFGFDAAAIARWLGQVRRRDVDVPIRIGIPGPATVKSLLHFAAVCGVRTGAAALSTDGISLTKLLGTSTPDRLLSELTAVVRPEADGRVRLHFHPFGGLDKAVQWVRESKGRRASRSGPT